MRQLLLNLISILIPVLLYVGCKSGAHYPVRRLSLHDVITGTSLYKSDPKFAPNILSSS